MGTTYWRAADDSDSMQLLMDVMQEHHQRLLAIHKPVTVALIFAMPEVNKHGEPKGPAVTHNGYKAAAVTRKTQLKQRAMGMPDAEITVDAYEWERMPRVEQEALLDHELTHIDLIYDNNEELYDDLGRPRIKMRKHDYQFGWFAEVAQRHGKASLEVQQAKQWMNQSGQLFLDFDKATAQSADE